MNEGRSLFQLLVALKYLQSLVHLATEQYLLRRGCFPSFEQLRACEQILIGKGIAFFFRVLFRPKNDQALMKERYTL